MTYYMLAPAVDGGFGEFTEYDPETRTLSSFHLELEDWQGDDLVTSTPGFAVTRRLADRLRTSGLSGFALKDLYVSISVEGTKVFDVLDLKVPDLVWLDITGAFGQDDFFLAMDTADLIVDQAAMDLLEEFTLDNCDIDAYSI
jgi:hypothetical protein